MATKPEEPKLGNHKYNTVYDQSTPEIYDQWAADGYDKTVASNSIAVHNLVSHFLSLVDSTTNTPLRLLDAGCGTGRVAEVCRAQAPASNIEIGQIDGIDYSPGMMDIARSKKELYSLLDVVDLTKPFPKTYLDNTYDAMLCSGVFLQGHVGPEAIPELSRVVKPNGMLCFTVRPTFFEETKEKWLLALEESGVDLIETKMLDYCPPGLKAPMLFCRKR